MKYIPDNNYWPRREFGKPYQWQRHWSLRNTVQVITRKQRSPGELAAIKRDNDNHDMRQIAFDIWLGETLYGEAVCREIERIGEAVR